MVTSEGPVDITFHRGWSPAGVDRIWHLMRNDFYAGARFYRVEEGFVAQWGFSGDPALDSLWKDHPVEDEPVRESNRRGVVSFARSGPETRSYTLFVNYTDNVRLDTLVVAGIRGYPPLGVIGEDGMAVLDGLYRAYADDPPAQDSIAARGNAYLRDQYPQLDSIVETRVTAEWP
jgi:peptidyl-prolyl cis-trans isomerase A (cyclophilin A)